MARNCQRRGNRRAIVETLFARCHHNGSRSLSSKIIMVGSLDGKLRYSNVKIVRFKSKVMSSIGFRPLHHPWGNVSIRCSATQNDGCVKFKPVVFLVRSQTCVEQFMPNSLSLIERWCLATVRYILYQRKYIPSGSLPNENDALDCKTQSFPEPLLTAVIAPTINCCTLVTAFAYCMSSTPLSRPEGELTFQLSPKLQT